MTKLLHLTHTDVKTDSRVLKEMEALANANFEVTSIGVELKEGAAESVVTFNATVDQVKLNSRRLKGVPRTLRHALSFCELLVKMVPRAIRSKPDVVHCHDTLVLPLGVIVKLVTRSRLIYDAHELESDRNGITKLQGRLTLLVERLLWRFVDALIVVSPSIQNWYSINFGSKPSAVILNSPLFKGFSSVDNKYLHRKFDIPSDRLIFIYVGILGKGRGLEFLIEAFSSQMINSHIVFIGFGELSERLRELEKSKSNFHLHESVPHSQVVPIASSADFGLCLVENVSLSDYYSLPNKLFEYCFAGIPVLASNFPDIKRIVDEHEVGQCCELDVEEIRSAVKNIEKSTATYSAKELEKLSWQEQEKILLDLYRSLFD